MRENNSLIKLAIFDLDGTLVDTVSSLEKSINLMLADYGASGLDRAQVKRFVGYGSKKFVESALAAKSCEPSVAEALDRYLFHFTDYCAYKAEPYPGICDLLREMQGRGIKISCLTNKPQAMAEKVLASCFDPHGIEFDRILGQSEAYPRKPDPTSSLALLAEFGLEPDQAIFIGDSDADMATAKAAGIRRLAVTWGFRTREELAAAGAETYIDQAATILDYL